ncbi:MAG: cache domain-containing protein, partial [Cyanobacteria bacterium J06560_2]
MNKRQRLPAKIPLRAFVLVPFVFQLLATVGLIGWFAYRAERSAVEDLGSQLQREVSARVEARINHYLSDLNAINATTADALNAGHLDTNDLPGLFRHFWRQSFLYDEVSYLYFGRTDGSFIGLYLNLEAERYYEESDSAGSFSRYKTDAQGQPIPERLEDTFYDPRIRPWYTNAVTAGQPTWTNLYLWTTVNQLGISLSQPYYDPATGVLLGVLSLDLNQNRLSSFLQQLTIGESGRVFVMERSGTLVASSSEVPPYLRNAVGERSRVQANEFDEPLVRTTARYLESSLLKNNTPQAQLPRLQASFDIDGDEHLVQATPLPERFGLDWLVVVVVPESDFVAQINVDRQTTLQLCGLLLLGSVGFTVWLAGYLTRPIVRLSQASQTLAETESEALGRVSHALLKPSRVKEINALTVVFQQMSRHLQVSYDTLARYSQSLEQKVKERTRELEQEVSDRTKSEQTFKTLVDNVPG